MDEQLLLKEAMQLLLRAHIKTWASSLAVRALAT